MSSPVCPWPVQTTGYFGSPPEPLFNDPNHCLGLELLEDTIKLLFQKNETATGSGHTRKGFCEAARHFNDENSVLFLFELSRHLELAPDVQYRAAELFHRFMINHIRELYAHVLKSQKSDSPIVWCDVEDRLKHQVILRAVSCVQLASKLSSHYHLVTLNRARAFLSQCGFRYASSSIVQSEVRVLKTIEFRVHHPTPLEFIEAILGKLAREDKRIPIKQLHGLSLKFLDLYYLSRHQVYSTLTQATSELENCDDSLTLLSTASVNYMYLAAAIIFAANIVIYESVADEVVGFLSKTCNIAEKYIINFATVLLREIFISRNELSDIPENI